MPSSGMLQHVAVLRTDVSEERSASIIGLQESATDARYEEISILYSY
jgi:hypothetical protein